MAAAAQAPLPDELKQFALSLDKTTAKVPKALLCTLCGDWAFDSWKLLCCNSTICASCHSTLTLPSSCPKCDHSPLEAENVVPHANARKTMRQWLSKAKDKAAKPAAKKALEPATPTTPAPEPHNADQAVAAADQPVQSVETAIKTEDDGTAAIVGDGEALHRAASAGSQIKEMSIAGPNRHGSRRGSMQSQKSGKTTEAAATKPDDADPAGRSFDQNGDGQGWNTNGGAQGQQMFPGQFGFDASQGNFNQMGWNGMNMGGMNGMAGMPNMNGNWGNFNGMTPDMMGMNNMGMPNMPNMSNGMFGNFGGNMGMNNMNPMNMMGYGGGFGSGWDGQMGGDYGNFNGGYNQMGYNQSGNQYTQMNSYPKNNFQKQNRFSGPGNFPQQRNFGNGGNGNYGPNGYPQQGSRPGSQAGLPDNSSRRSSKQMSVDPTQHATTEHAAQGKVDETSTDQPGTVDAANTDQTRTAADDAEGKVENVITKSADSNRPAANGAQRQPKENASPAEGPTEGNDLAAASNDGLNRIQTVDTMEPEGQTFDNASMFEPMQNQGFQQGMMNSFQNQMPNMDMNMQGGYGPMNSYHQGGYAPRGGYNAAYGAATVLTGEPRGVGVVGAPTGPRAMREGRPNTGFSSRANNARYNAGLAASGNAPAQNVRPASSERRARASPQRDETLRTKQKSPSRSRSRTPAQDDGNDGNHDEERRDRDDRRERSSTRSSERHHKRKHRDRSFSPTSEDDYERRKERRHHRSSKYDDYDDRGSVRDEDYDDRHRDEKDDRESRRSASVESKHRSRRNDKEKHRSSRSHRDRSREHRRRHRSRSPGSDERYEDDEAYVNGTDLPSESSSRRKSRSERHRDRSRDKDRDRRDRRERDYDDDYERRKDRDRDRKRSRRDRSADPEDDRDYDDDKYHRSSRRSRRDRDRERDREYDRDDDRDYDRDYDRHHDDDRERDRGRDYDSKPTAPEAPRYSPPPADAPKGPKGPKQQEEFSFLGQSKKRAAAVEPKPAMAPPTGPRALQPPKGPAADRNRGHDRRNSSLSIPPKSPMTPTTPAAEDPYAIERQRRERERLEVDRKRAEKDRERSGRDEVVSRMASLANPRKSGSSGKRQRDEVEDSNTAAPIDAPTGPRGGSGGRNSFSGNGDNKKRRTSMVQPEADITARFTKGQRKKHPRKIGVRYEGDEGGVERGERERDGGRY